MRVAVVGTGYVGLVTGVVLADLGNDVICVDNDEAKLQKLREGVCPIFEPGLEEVLKKVLAEGCFRVTNSIAEATKASEIVFIAVGTPPGPDGTPDVRAVRAVAEEIGKAIDGPKVIVNKSTVPVGSGDMVSEIIRAQGVPDERFEVVSNPEFLREGSALQDTLHPDRVVIGSKSQAAADKLAELYRPLDAPYLFTDVNSAELLKYASNCFLATKISFVNALSRICEIARADVGAVAKGMGMDQRIGSQFLQAGLGWGGSCFPKDVQGLIAISDQLGYDFQLLRAVWEINDQQTRHFVDRVRTRLGGFSGKTVGLLGLSFKPNTDDIRDAKSLVILSIALSEGATVRAYDPVAQENVRQIEPRAVYVDSAYQAAEGADVLILVTEWNEFKQLDWERIGTSMRSRVLFDGRRIYSRAELERAGFEFHTVGS